MNEFKSKENGLDFFTSYKIDETSGEIKGLVYNEYYGLGSNVVPDRQVT